MLRQTHGIDPRIAQGFVILVHDDSHGDVAVQRHADTVAHDAIHRANLGRAVKVGPSAVDIFNDLGLVARQVDHHAVNGQNTLHPLGVCDFGVLAQMAVLTMHRDQNLRLDHVMQRFQIGTVGVA